MCHHVSDGHGDIRDVSVSVMCHHVGDVSPCQWCVTVSVMCHHVGVTVSVMYHRVGDVSSGIADWRAEVVQPEPPAHHTPHFAAARPHLREKFIPLAITHKARDID